MKKLYQSVELEIITFDCGEILTFSTEGDDIFGGWEKPEGNNP